MGDGTADATGGGTLQVVHQIISTPVFSGGGKENSAWCSHGCDVWIQFLGSERIRCTKRAMGDAPQNHPVKIRVEEYTAGYVYEAKSTTYLPVL